jgi:putative transposase
MEQGNLYHIYNRGNNKQLIFFERKNYIYFLKLFKNYLSSYIDVYAYCLMPNHFHFLIKIKEHSQTSVVFQTIEVFSEITD